MSEPTLTAAAQPAAVADPTGPTDPDAVPRSRTRVLRAIGRWSLVPLTLVAFVVIWQLVIVIFDVSAYILPRPLAVWDAYTANQHLLLTSLWVTLRETLYGFLIAVGVGTVLSLLIAASQAVERVVYPILVATNGMPKIALAPIFLAWLGLGTLPRVMMAALLAVFPIIINTVVGLVGVDRGLIQLGKANRSSAVRMFFFIRLPAAMPSVMAGYKLGITLALTGAVVGEFIGGDTGIGYVIVGAQNNLVLDLAFAGIVLLGLAGVVLFYIVDAIERRVLRWR